MSTLLLLVVAPLLGLAFILLVGRRRRTPAGIVNAPAPGSAEAPLFAKPHPHGAGRRKSKRS